MRGLLNTVTGGVNWDAHLWKAFYPLQKPLAVQSRYLPPRAGQASPLALLAGATYHSGSDEVVPWLRAKQQLRTPGAWRLKLRGTVQYPAKSQEVREAGAETGCCMQCMESVIEPSLCTGDRARGRPAQPRGVQSDASPGCQAAGRLQGRVAAQPAACIREAKPTGAASATKQCELRMPHACRSRTASFERTTGA